MGQSVSYQNELRTVIASQNDGDDSVVSAKSFPSGSGQLWSAKYTVMSLETKPLEPLEPVFRYLLTAELAEPSSCKGFLMVIGCNPSKANAEDDDPTISKLGRWAKINGYRGIQMANLFAYRETDPVEMRAKHSVGDLVGPYNDKWIEAISASSEDIVFAMGDIAFKGWKTWTDPNCPEYVEKAKERRECAKERLAHVQRLVNSRRNPTARLMVFKLTRSNNPGHVLYLPDSLSMSSEWVDITEQIG